MQHLVNCTHCGKALKASDKHLGRRLKCPNCKQPFLVQLDDDSDLPVVEVEIPVQAPLGQPPSPAPMPTAQNFHSPSASPVPTPPSTPSTASAPPKTPAGANPFATTVDPPNPPAPATTSAAANSGYTNQPIPQHLIPPSPNVGINRQQKVSQTINALRQSFRGQIAPVATTEKYRFAIAGVSFVMVMLPIIYLILIVGVIALTAWYAVAGTQLFSMEGQSRGGRAVVVGFFLYLTPIIVGITMIIFMIKPIFARPEAERGRSVTAQGEPILFEFVRQICEAVGSPFPTRIDVDCHINASAGFRKGIRSMFGHDLVLTIGVPLTAGLNMQQMAGVLAHEFGHFSQGAGMRLSHLIRTINFWFMRVVFERDEWDAWLVDMTHDLDIRLSFPLWIARLCVFLNRCVLWVLMMVGHGVSSILLRQMEFDADRYETRLVGSRVFETTCYELQRLGVSYTAAVEDTLKLMQMKKLADNFPLLMTFRRARLPDAKLAIIDREIANSTTGLFDTHPCDRERVANAYAEQAEGVFQNTLPASALFLDFETLSKNVTQDFYSEIFGSRVPINRLIPVTEIIKRAEK